MKRIVLALLLGLLSAAPAHAVVLWSNVGVVLEKPSWCTFTNGLVWNDSFTAPVLNTSLWNPYIGDSGGRWNNGGALPAPISAENSGSYQVQYNNPYPYGDATDVTGEFTFRLQGGGANLIGTMTPSTKYAGYTWGSTGISNVNQTLPSTGGCVQWYAKQPDSTNGMWFGLWLISSGNPEIDVQESGQLPTAMGLPAGTPVNNIMACHWWGVGGSQIGIDAGFDLSAGYHTYGLFYNPGVAIDMYLDGVRKCHFTTSIPTASYRVMIEAEVAGALASTFHTVSDPVGHPGPYFFGVKNAQVWN